MYPLAVVEKELGSIESWPSGVIMDMFDCGPTARVSRRVAAHMYGNGVNVSDVVKCYRACNNVWKAIKDTHTYSWYFNWEKGDPIKCKHTFYYSMKKCVMWLRGDERVTPEIIVRDFGPARCRWPGMLVLRIEQVRVEGTEKGRVINCVHVVSNKTCLLV